MPDLPKTDVVLECKLDPVNNLWDLRDHSENRHPNEILVKERQTLAQPERTAKSQLPEHAQMHVLTWDMLGWFSMGWMCSVTRSAQADVRTVAMMRMTRDLHRDQWTTAPWWPVAAQTVRLWSVMLALDDCTLTVLQFNNVQFCVSCNWFIEGDSYLVLLQHGCHICGSASSMWISDQWCRRPARGQTLCTPVAWRWQEHTINERAEK